MDLDLEPGWSLQPVGGTTGGAFMGVFAHEKFFLKRNASPFLAALSVEGITPKLIWTKRISTGDVLTAQEWLNGRTLTREQMNTPMVAGLLAKVHRSTLLKRMLQKVGGLTQTPEQLRAQYVADLPQALRKHPLVLDVSKRLRQLPPRPRTLWVCHGDLNHKNWLLSDAEKLYLVDWDQASLGDIAFDLSVVLINYVPRAEWGAWLAAYGTPLSADLLARIEWYGQLHLLNEIKRNYEKQRYTEMNRALLQLSQLVAK
ncbi:phosphotransferase family protein [Lacticaseibacillus parakribbianus]|uniref:phosphotransferase family protein n=1 Tax=Lacticaseibacillus parakribbianus TaxID=2970927 RepID=UPI0021CB7AAC|nr:phosphotransferase family protein [Lacticaseibacillus parakribbianus]